MKNLSLVLILSIQIFSYRTNAQTPNFDKSRDGFLVFHEIKTGQSGKIVSWYNNDPGKAFDFVVNAVWNFWDTMRTDMNGLPYLRLPITHKKVIKITPRFRSK